MQQVYITEEALDNELMEGEELLWSGRSHPQGKRIASPTRGLLIVGSIFLPLGLLLLMIGVIVLSMLYYSGNAAASLGLFIPGGVLLIEGMIFFLIGIVGRSPDQKMLYAITDRRVIILREGRHLRVSSYTSRAISQVHRIERADGSGDLIFSGNQSSYSFGYAGDNASSYNSAYRLARLGAFTAIPNVRQVEQKLLRMLDRH